MLCSLLPVKYASANGNSLSLTTRKSHWMPPSKITLAFVSPFASDFHDARLRDKKFNHVRRFFRRRQQINVADDFLEPPQTARRAATDHVGMSAQIFQQRLGGAQRVAQQMFARVSPFALDAFQNVRLRFFAETVQFRNFSLFAGRFQFFNRINSEFFVQRLDFFRPERRKFPASQSSPAESKLSIRRSISIFPSRPVP